MAPPDHLLTQIILGLVVLVLINVGAVTVFGEVEVVCSLIKFSWIFVVILSMIGMVVHSLSYSFVWPSS